MERGLFSWCVVSEKRLMRIFRAFQNFGAPWGPLGGIGASSGGKGQAMPGRMILPPVIMNNVNDLPVKIAFPAEMKGGCAYLN